MAGATKEMEFVPLFNEFLARSPVIELLAKSLLENKEEVRMSPKNYEIGFEKYLIRTVIC